MTTYLSPKSDASFKKVFGNDAYYDITINFLNSMLELTNTNEIEKISFKDPANIKDSLMQANSFVDVHCTDVQGRHFLIEMQIAPQAFFIKRAIYYAAWTFSRQLSVIDYNKLVPVIILTILDHIKFKNHDNVISRYVFTDKNTGKEIEENCLQLHFVELPKFKKNLHELKSNYDEWLFFLQNAATLQEIPQQLNNPVFKDAFHLLDKMTWTEIEFRDYVAQMDKADQPRREELARLEAAKEEGIEQGKEEGAQEKAIESAIKMLKKNVALSDIAEFTGLSIDIIQELQKKL